VPSDGAAPRERREHRRSIAQWFCLVTGPVLVLVGLLGFLAESRFDTASGGDPGALDGHDFIIFEVNGWHNVVHIASGLLLLVGAFRHRLAKTVLIVFGLAYAAVSVIGLADGKDVLGLFPVDKQDNVLHIVLALAALIIAFASTRDDEAADRRTARVDEPGAVRAQTTVR
jgi:uncharacterized membrane protein YiaA